MITKISNVDTVTGSGQINFDVDVDAAGADEDVSTKLNGDPFKTPVKVARGGDGSGQSIAHTKHGLHTVTLLAETSKVSSRDFVLDL